MGKVIIDFTEDGEVITLFDSENNIDRMKEESSVISDSKQDLPVIEIQDDVDMKPDDTLEDAEDEEEGDE